MVKNGRKKDENRRLTVVFQGRVQGVGFRFSSVRAAESLDVSGYVMNEPDGSVFLLAEGTEADLKHLLEKLRDSSVGRKIKSETVNWGAATGEFNRFEIRYF
ncbi:MAG: acylphosphatase [Verrucomicrobiota bacterium]